MGARRGPIDALGADFVPLYRTRLLEPEPPEGDVVVLASGSAARAYSRIGGTAPAVTIGPEPQADPKFKWIAVDAGAIRHPDWTAEQHAQSIKHDIDQALDRGYRVVVSDVWSWSADELAGQLGGLSAADRATAIYRMLHDNYEAQPTFSDPVAGPYYELRRQPGR